MNCKVSVIIVTWNSEEDIVNCINSINIGKIIVVDNASQDNTVNIIKERFPEINPGPSRRGGINMIENSYNAGLSKATNQAAKLAKGDYLLLLNPDVILMEDTIKKLYEFMERDNTIGACAPKFLSPTGQVQSSCREFPSFKNIFLEFSGLWRITRTGWKMRYFDHNTTREVDQPMGSCLLVRRTLFNELGGMNERYPLFMNDVDLCYKIKKTGYKIYFLAEASITHKLGGSTYKVRRKMILSLHWSMYRYLKDHFANKFLVNLSAFLLLMSVFYRSLFAPKYSRECRFFSRLRES